jgi:hypothetical protein
MVDRHNGIPSLESMLFALFGCSEALQAKFGTGLLSGRSTKTQKAT